MIVDKQAFFSCIDFYNRVTIIKMENSNTDSQSGNSQITVTIVVIILLVVGISYFKNSNLGQNQNNNPSTLEEAKSALLQTSSFPEPEINSPQTINDASLPKDLRGLLDSNATNVLIQQAKNEEGKNVFMISFAVESPLLTYHQQTLSALGGKDAKFTIAKSSRTSVFALIEAENAVYSLRISETKVSETITDILIEAQTK